MNLVIIIFFMTIVLTGILVFVILTDNSSTKVLGRNYQVRFSAQNNKYYIVNSTDYKGDIHVTGRFGFTIYYKDRVEADLVAQKLNTVE